MAATIKYFGGSPTTIVMRSSTQLNGTAQLNSPVLSPGSYVFPAQVGGGLYDLHDEPVEVVEMSYKGGGTCTVKKVNSSTSSETELCTMTDEEPVYDKKITLQMNESLKFVTLAAATPEVSVTGLALLRWNGGR